MQANSNRSTGVFDFRNQSVIDWFIQDLAGSPLCLNNSAVDGMFLDDTDGLGSPGTADRTPIVKETGLSDAEVVKWNAGQRQGIFTPKQLPLVDSSTYSCLCCFGLSLVSDRWLWVAAVLGAQQMAVEKGKFNWQLLKPNGAGMLQPDADSCVNGTNLTANPGQCTKQSCGLACGFNQAPDSFIREGKPTCSPPQRHTQFGPGDS